MNLFTAAIKNYLEKHMVKNGKKYYITSMTLHNKMQFVTNEIHSQNLTLFLLTATGKHYS